MQHVRMTVGDLRKAIDGLGDDVPVLVPGLDHSYRPARGRSGTAIFEKEWGWSEDFGDMNPTEITEAMRKQALIIGEY